METLIGRRGAPSIGSPSMGGRGVFTCFPAAGSLGALGTVAVARARALWARVEIRSRILEGKVEFYVTSVG